MNVPAIKPQVEAADVPIQQLLDNRQLDQEQKLAEVARQFEAVLLRQILRQTQQPVFPSEFTDNSTAANIYHDLVTEQLADTISKSGTLGLAKMLQLQLNHQLHPASMAGHDCATEAQPTSLSGAGAARPSTCSARPSPDGSGLHPPNRGTTALTSHE
jgi:Rod binding domain-containing protein